MAKWKAEIEEQPIPKMGGSVNKDVRRVEKRLKQWFEPAIKIQSTEGLFTLFNLIRSLTFSLPNQ